MTLEAWVRPQALGTPWRTVLFKEDPIGSTSGQAYALYASSKTGAPVAMIYTATETRAVAAHPLRLGRWAHLAATYDGSALRIYVNGVLSGSAPAQGSLAPTTGPLRIGGNQRFGEFFNGAIDDVRVYNRALSSADLRHDMKTPVRLVTGPAVKKKPMPKPKPKPKQTPPPNPPPVAVGPASAFVATGGSDANPCTSTSPCSSLQRALNVARPGAIVQVAAGSYPGQTLQGGHDGAAVTFRPSADGRVTMAGRLTLAGVRNINLVNFTFPRSDPNFDLLFDACNSGVSLYGSTGRRFFILEGNSNISFIGGSWGGYSNPGDEDSSIGTAGVTGPERTCGGTLAPPSNHILFDGITFHDIFWGKTVAQWGGSHPDCFEINGYAMNVTIRNSTFIRCQDSFFAIYPDQGDIVNVTVDHNTFQDLGNTTYYGSQWVSTATHKCGGIVFSHNTWRPNNPDGKYPYGNLRVMCQPPPGSAPAQIIANAFQKGPVSQDCAQSKAAPYLTVWRDNTFTLGGACRS